MTRLRPKKPRLRLKPKGYHQLRRHVLERDGWRCQRCGGLNQLQVHHVKRRSALGDDTAENLVALCPACHQAIHTKIAD